jgi:hypothetical protein
MGGQNPTNKVPIAMTHNFGLASFIRKFQRFHVTVGILGCDSTDVGMWCSSAFPEGAKTSTFGSTKDAETTLSISADFNVTAKTLSLS